jgi:succinyl-diaminopimelate desuccinylase
VAYPQRADNPVPKIARMIDRLSSEVWDEGSEHFQPTHLEVTTLDVGNPATNVIPGQARAVFNLRWNDRQTPEKLDNRIRAICKQVTDEMGGSFELTTNVGGEAFLTQPGTFTALLQDAVEEVQGARPALTTTGGTSDARFIKTYCPVAEFGLVGKTMHQVDERVPIADIERLSAIYLGVLRRYFAQAW